MATAVAPPSTPKVTTSVDPIYTQALSQAKAALNAERQPVQDAQAASDAQYKAQAQDATDAGNAAAGLLKGIAPAIQSDYQNAAQNQELAGAAFSAGMQDALNKNTDGLNAVLSKLGSPAQIDSHAGQVGDVLYGLGGFIPGTTFAKQGAAAAGAAENLPADAILKGQQASQELTAKGLLADASFQNKLATIAAKLPGQTETNYVKLQGLVLQNKRFQLAVTHEKFAQATAIAKQKLAVAKYNTSVSEFNARQTLAANKFAYQQFKDNRAYSLQFQRLGIEKQRLQQTIIANSFKAANGGYSAKDMAKMTTQAFAYAQTAKNGETHYSTQTVNGVKTSVPVQTGQLTYKAAMISMLKKGWPVQVVLNSLDQAYGTPPPEVQQAIADQLGPLAPAELKQSIAQFNANLQIGGLAMTNPAAILEQSAPQTRQIKQYAFTKAAQQFGWGDQQNIDALDQLWVRESGWNPYSVNKKSGAYGIPQALGHGHVFNLGDWQSQVDWGLNYIAGRYGSPMAALAHENAKGWY